MKWFKHMANSANDEKLALLRSEFGLEGYGFWWRIMEIVAEKVDEFGRDYAEFPLKYWGTLLELSPRKFQKLAECCSNLGLIILENDKNLVRVFIPNILKYRDEHTIRQSKNSRVTREKLRPLLKELEIEEEYIRTPHSPPKFLEQKKEVGVLDFSENFEGNSTPKKTDCPSKGHPQFTAFKSCFAVYPVQQGEESAWREWMRLYENGTLGECYAIREKIITLSTEDSRWIRGFAPKMHNWLNAKGWNDFPFVPREKEQISSGGLSAEEYGKLQKEWEDENGHDAS